MATVNDAQMRARLDAAEARARDLRPVLAHIGAVLVADAQLCFKGSHTPWGDGWAPLKRSTLLKRAARRTGGNPYKRGGGFKKKAVAIMASAKPLLDTARLRNSIAYRIEGNTVVVGTNVVYAGTHQFGAKKGQYGTTRTGSPIPWGNVPARAFLPMRVPGAVSLPEKVSLQVSGLIARYVDTGRP